MREGIGRAKLGAVKVVVLAGTLAVPLGACQAPSGDGVATQRSALTGDTVSTIVLPPPAQCPVVAGAPDGIGTSVAIVPAGLLGLDLQYNTLMVTSCFSTGADRANLYVTDPLTGNLVTTITTSTAPPEGWGSLSLRGNKGDLIGCGNDPSGTHAIYSINVNVNSPVGAPLGATTFLFNGASGADICDGVSYDSSDDTVWMSPDVSPTVYHYDTTGTLLGSFPAPSGCPNSGIAVSGSSLFLACDGDLTLYQVNKSTGAVFTSFTTPPPRNEDLECDPETFGASGAATGKDVMWTKDAYTNTVYAFEIPRGTCGVAGGPPVIPLACADGSTTDSDGDGLLDCWETDGIDFDGDGVIDLQLYDINGDGVIDASEKADPNHKDLYLEVDWMTGHEPSAAAVSDVIAAFAASPVTNPDGTTGIRLHVQDDGVAAVAEALQTAFEPCTAPAGAGDADFEAIKRAQFGTAAERASANSVNILGAKHAAFRYQLWVHDLKNLGSTSGCAELPGNDSVVSLGDWGSPPARIAQSGTMMHEFGHTLQLRHGGVDHVNYKPNFISVMNYSFQDNRYVAARSLDYSPFALPTLDETALSEGTGLPCAGGCTAGDSLAARTTVFFSPGAVTTPLAPNIDWNQNGTIDAGTVSLSINRDATVGTLLSRNDWASLLYNFRGTLDFAEGVHLTTTITKEADFVLAMTESADDDHDGVPNVTDNCPTVPNPDQASLFNDGVGTACLAQPTVDCVDHTPKRTFVAHFGYKNPNIQINVPIGPQNQFVPGPADRGQLTKFASGTVRNAFTVASTGPDLVWSLNGFKATASHQTRDCGDHP